MEVIEGGFLGNSDREIQKTIISRDRRDHAVDLEGFQHKNKAQLEQKVSKAQLSPIRPIYENGFDVERSGSAVKKGQDLGFRDFISEQLYRELRISHGLGENSPSSLPRATPAPETTMPAAASASLPHSSGGELSSSATVSLNGRPEEGVKGGLWPCPAPKARKTQVSSACLCSSANISDICSRQCGWAVWVAGGKVEAKEVWELGKELGVTFQGDENFMLIKMEELELRDMGAQPGALDRSREATVPYEGTLL